MLGPSANWLKALLIIMKTTGLTKVMTDPLKTRFYRIKMRRIYRQEVV